MGGLIIYHFFHFGPKKLVIFLENKLEFIVYEGCHKKCIVQHPAHFRLFFLNVQAEKLVPHFQLSFESWLNNADSELYIFSFKMFNMVAGKS